MQVARPRKKQDAEHRVLTLLLFNEKHIAFRTTKTHRRSQIPVRITPSRMRYGSETHRVRSTLFVFWFCYSSRSYLLTCKSCLFSKADIYAPDFNSLLLHKRKKPRTSQTFSSPRIFLRKLFIVIRDLFEFTPVVTLHSQ